MYPHNNVTIIPSPEDTGYRMYPLQLPGPILTDRAMSLNPQDFIFAFNWKIMGLALLWANAKPKIWMQLKNIMPCNQRFDCLAQC